MYILAPKPVGKNEFSDILNAQGFKSAAGGGQESGPQTLKSLKKEQNKSEDPVKAKVRPLGRSEYVTQLDLENRPQSVAVLLL